MVLHDQVYYCQTRYFFSQCVGLNVLDSLDKRQAGGCACAPKAEGA